MIEKSRERISFNHVLGTDIGDDCRQNKVHQ